MISPKRKTEPPATDVAAAGVTLQIEYLGPAGQTSPVFGALRPGQRYTADADFAAYLVAIHPDYWKLAPAGTKE